MDINNLNILYFLVYIEIMQLVLGLTRTILNFLVSIILIPFNIVQYKLDVIMMVT